MTKDKTVAVEKWEGNFYRVWNIVDIFGNGHEKKPASSGPARGALY